MKRILFLAIATITMATSVAQKRAFTIADLYRVRSVYGVTLSPDGKTIAYTANKSDLKASKSSSDIYVMDADGKNVKAVTTDGKSSGATWSKDGKSLFFSSSLSGQQQIYRYDSDKGTAEKLTDFELGVSDAVVSPDGNLIAFTANVYPALGADGKANAAAIKKRSEGPMQAHIADKLLYRHWTEYSDGLCQHIIVFDISKKTYTDVTPGNFVSPIFMAGGGVGFNFSPDSKEICYVSNHTEHQEANTNADLWLVPVTGGEARNITADNEAWDGSPIYSPDGKYIAYRTQTVPGYESDRFRLALYDRQTGQKTVLTENFDNWVDDYKWTADSRSIFFLGEETGYQPLFKVDLRSKKITKLIADRAISAFDIDNKGNAFFTYSTTGKPSALYRERIGKSQTEQQLTFLNKELEDEVDIRPSETMWVTGADGDRVEVFIVKPHGFDASKKYPLVINVHGGPQMQWMNSFRGDWQVYPSAGYVVAYPNPHGSTGYGQKFTRDISGNWGSKPYEDVMKVTDALAQLSYVDSTRMGAMGWSYGGYFMNWLQGHTKRFKCLASMMGLFDLRSMWGATEELWFPNFDLQGQPWNSDLYKKFSPSEYVGNFATPTLVITGEKDYRVPYTQSLQYFNTLQTLGIPSRLIVFKNDGHWPSNLKSMPLYYNAHLEWFHKYLGGDPAPWDSEKMVENQQEY
jgi:dipeptidyl aminopeptidase/acylaminoacyl peptidase